LKGIAKSQNGSIPIWKFFKEERLAETGGRAGNNKP